MGGWRHIVATVCKGAVAVAVVDPATIALVVHGQTDQSIVKR